MYPIGLSLIGNMGRLLKKRSAMNSAFPLFTFSSPFGLLMFFALRLLLIFAAVYIDGIVKIKYDISKKEGSCEYILKNWFCGAEF
jgi:hypothetical protein